MPAGPGAAHAGAILPNAANLLVFPYFFPYFSTMQNGTLLAAVDLGSNSFRLEIGRQDNGHIQRVEYLLSLIHISEPTRPY